MLIEMREVPLTTHDESGNFQELPPLPSHLVFGIPLDEGRYALGQILAVQFPICLMVGFDRWVSPDELDAVTPTALGQSIVAGNFFDVLIRNSRWVSLNRIPPPVGITFPKYKIVINGRTYVESWDRSQCHPASESEILRLPFRRNHGPMLLERALRAFHGLDPWHKNFDELLIRGR